MKPLQSIINNLFIPGARSRAGCFFLLLFFNLNPSFGQTIKEDILPPDWSDTYHQILKLQTRSARSKLSQPQLKDRDKASAILLANYVDCLYLFITEDESHYKKQKAIKKERLSQLDKLNIPHAHKSYIQADIQLQWAIIRFKFGDYFSAFSETRKGYKLLKDIVEQPDALPAYQMRFAILEVLIGTVPEPYAWGAKMIGMQGDIQSGMLRLRKAGREAKAMESPFLPEILATEALLLLHVMNEPAKSIHILEDPIWQKIAGPLHIFLAASIHRKTANTDEALVFLKRYQEENSDISFDYLYYMLGESMLHKQQKDAHKPLLRYLKQYKGQHYRKAALQKLAWHAMLHEGEDAYFVYMNRIKNEGIKRLDEDRSAWREYSQQKAPHPKLLEARLLFDGGYYNQSLQVLEANPVHSFSWEEHILEHHYRKARNLDLLKKNQEALKAYSKVIELGRYNSSYYACNAALQRGFIFEKLLRYKEASEAFEDCLSMKPDEYRTGLHQKAKAGLLRIKNKI